MPFNKRKKIVSVFFDLTKTFDYVWREGLLLKLREAFLEECTYGPYASYTTNQQE